jgi:hypothetical protein
MLSVILVLFALPLFIILTSFLLYYLSGRRRGDDR